MRERRGIFIAVLLISHGIADIDTSIPVELAVEEKGNCTIISKVY